MSMTTDERETLLDALEDELKVEHVMEATAGVVALHAIDLAGFDIVPKGREASVKIPGAIPCTTDYANGWNDCRHETYDLNKRHPAPQAVPSAESLTTIGYKLTQINALCESSHWTSERRWKIAQLAQDALVLLAAAPTRQEGEG